MTKLINLKNQYRSIIGSRTMGSISYLLSASLLNAMIGLITSVFFLRYVDKEIIAVIYPLISILNIVGYFGDFGLSNSFVKMASSLFAVDQFKSLQFFNAAFKLKLFLCILILLLGIPAAEYIAKWTFGEPIYVYWVKWILVITSVQILASYAMTALQVEGKFVILSLIKVIPTLLKMIMLGLVIWMGVATLAWTFYRFCLYR